ncbi:MAG: hypothetical protein V3S64_03405 [bacterium]
MLKRVLLLVFMATVLINAPVWAQERGPLVMRVEFEWSVVGIIAGAALGALLWLTDPADPNANLSDSLANGAAWGAILGAGFGVFVLQETAISPPITAFRSNPLHPKNRITTDPVAVESGERGMFATGGIQYSGKTVVVPFLNIRF